MLGIDLLGGPKYRQHAVDAFRRLTGNWAAGVFWNEFGNAAKLIKGLYGVGCRTFRIHIVWDDRHDYSSEARQREAIREYKHCVKLMSHYPEAKLYVSLFCEHNLGKEVVRRKIEEARAHSKAQGFKVPVFVNNPWKGDRLGDKEVLNEVHGLDSAKPGGRYLVSPDGATLDAGNSAAFNARYRGALIRFAWAPALNCHRSEGDNSRDYRPSADEIVALANLLTGPKPKAKAPPAFRGMRGGVHARASRMGGVIGFGIGQRERGPLAGSLIRRLPGIHGYRA